MSVAQFFVNKAFVNASTMKIASINDHRTCSKRNLQIKEYRVLTIEKIIRAGRHIVNPEEFRRHSLPRRRNALIKNKGYPTKK